MATQIIKGLNHEPWIYGDPTLEAGGAGKASWTDSGILAGGLDDTRQVQWMAKLDGGTQASYDDYAKVVIPVANIPLRSLKTVKLMPYYTESSGVDMGVCLYMQDPNDLDQRIELSHTTLTNTAAGWRELDWPDTGDHFFWYGNVTDTPDTCPTEGTSYTMAEFRTDSVFKDWVVYKITLDYGYYTGGEVMNGCYLAQVFINGTQIPLEPSIREQIASLKDSASGAIKTTPSWTFGKPTLFMMGNGRAHWARGSGALGTQHKGSTGWVARLFGGTQTGYDDAASLVIPVNEMPLPDLDSMSWSYHMKDGEVFGCQIQIYVHDPAQPENRADIIQSGAAVLLDKAQNWNSHILNADTPAQFFWYGENVTGEALTEGPDNLYSLAEFKADTLFSTWTIYRITLNNGYYDGGSFADTYVADVKINGTVIPLYPDIQRFRRAVTTQKILECVGGYAGGDVMSENDTDGAGTDWDFDFGTSGRVVQAVIATETTSITAAVDLYLFSSPPTCELDDNAVSDAPVLADLPYFIGLVEFSAMVYVGAGPSYAIATDLSIDFDTPTIYGVAVDSSGQDFDDGKTCDITLTAELET